MQKLQAEGLYNFKNVPDKAAKSNISAKNNNSQVTYKTSDVAYRQFNPSKSFNESPSPEGKTEKHHMGSSVGADCGSEDLMASRTTKGSSLMSSSNTAGTLLHNKSSLSSGASSSPKVTIKGAAQANLPVIEEELMVEEGCDNELESHRVTLQKIRQASMTWNEKEMEGLHKA